mmetsp:Transcript_84886/g.238946  ORF Transcript_84886/g.238946 Transcript_84886/m.238946 type:complete len:223 (-) Transcript_84886:781-1449(-)
MVTTAAPSASASCQASRVAASSSWSDQRVAKAEALAMSSPPSLKKRAWKVFAEARRMPKLAGKLAAPPMPGGVAAPACAISREAGAAQRSDVEAVATTSPPCTSGCSAEWCTSAMIRVGFGVGCRHRASNVSSPTCCSRRCLPSKAAERFRKTWPGARMCAGPCNSRSLTEEQGATTIISPDSANVGFLPGSRSSRWRSNGAKTCSGSSDSSLEPAPERLWI